MPLTKFVDPTYPGWKGHDPLEPYTHSGAIYHCPEADAKLAGNYEYRAALSLSQPKSGQPVDDNARTIVLSPSSVVAFCWEHTTYLQDHRLTGSFNVLRADTSASRIPASRAAIWTYDYSSRTWIGPPASHTAMGRLFPIVPEEPWPPQFEER